MFSTEMGQEIAVLLRQEAAYKPQMVITQHCGNRWVSILARLVAVNEDEIVVTCLPAADGSENAVSAARVGLNFRFRHRRYSMFTDVVRLDGSNLVLAMPKQARCISSRLYDRVAVPSSEMVTVGIWPGGLEMRPAGGGGDIPFWSAGVIDLSLGGFQVRCAVDATQLLGPGDIVGVEMSFAMEFTSLLLNAHLCYAKQDGPDMAFVGFKFSGLEADPARSHELAFLMKKIKQYG
jgi:hypothetical protein